MPEASFIVSGLLFLGPGLPSPRPPRGTGARGTPKHLIPTRAQSIYDATAVIVLYTFLVHQTYDTSEVSLHKNEIFPYFVSTNNFT